MSATTERREWRGVEGVKPGKIFVRVCREHREVLKETPAGELICPSGDHLVEEDGFRVKAAPIPKTLTLEQAARHREALSWVAGVFDVRGIAYSTTYAASKNAKRYHRVIVRIGSRDRALLDSVRATVGLGAVLNQNTKSPVGWKKSATYRFQVQNQTAVTFLRAIRPFLRRKAHAADEVLNGKTRGAA